MSPKEWRALAWLPGYEISEDGEVRRTVSVGSNLAGRLLKGFVSAQGYSTVCINRAGTRRRFRVHRLVCEAWHGPPPAGAVAAHDDGNPQNNTFSNLRWATIAENMADKVRHGTVLSGEKNPFSKLTNAAVAHIRSECASSPEQVSALAERYGVSTRTISRVARGQSWQATP